MKLDELHEETREKLGLGTSFPDEIVSQKLIVLAKILSALKGLTNRVALSVLDQAKLHISGQNAEALVNLPESMEKGAVTAHTPPIGWTLQVVARFFNLKAGELKERRRDAEVVEARHVAMYILWQTNEYTLTEIGKAIGGRGPSTVSHGYQQIAKRIAENPVFSVLITEILSRL